MLPEKIARLFVHLGAALSHLLLLACVMYTSLVSRIRRHNDVMLERIEAFEAAEVRFWNWPRRTVPGRT
jgi:hypothetical protein